MGNDSTYMWMSIITAVAFAVGITVAVLSWQEYVDPQLDPQVTEPIFQSN